MIRTIQCTRAASAVVLAASLAAAQSTVRLSVDSLGTQGNDHSAAPVITPDGRFVAFGSLASNLVPGDTNGTWDFFLLDRLNSTLELVSVDSAGVQGNGASGGESEFLRPGISSDGRYLVFDGEATNLVASDTNGVRDIFLRDRQSGTTERVSVDSAGAQGNAMSRRPSISADGRYVAFLSHASNLVAGDANLQDDVFVRDLLNGTTECVSVDALGFVGNDRSGWNLAPAISSDGRFVAFESEAANLIPGDTNWLQDIFVRDRLNAVTERVSVGPAGVQGTGNCYNSSISADGRFVAFLSFSSNLIAGDTNGDHGDVFVRDRQLGTTQCVSVDSNELQGLGETVAGSSIPWISEDGRFVAFHTWAPLVTGDTNNIVDAFLRDRQLGTTERVSLSTNGAQVNGASRGPSISTGARLVVFSSYANGLVTGDTNAALDVFIRDRGIPPPVAFCFGDGSSGGCPCFNLGQTGAGCENSASTGGAVLTGAGSPALTGDTFVLTSSGELPSVLSIFLQGDASISGVVFGDGLRCTGGALKRLYTHNAVGGVVSAPQAGEPSVSARSAALGDTLVAGTTRYYQTYYRDPQLAFCANPPGNSWNVSSGISIVWDP